MKKLGLYLILWLAVAAAGCHDEYDDSDLRSRVEDLASRVERLETWCNTVNGQISALQGLVSALENNDYVTGITPIMEGTKEVGYTITFTKSGPVTILHGRDGAKGDKGDPGITPVIGVKQDTDGLYYWTVQVGQGEAAWLLDDSGNKVPTTGDKGEAGTPGVPGQPGSAGHSPRIGVAEFDGELYWQIDGEWLLHEDRKVPATGAAGATGPAGANGDSIFAEDGVDTSDPENVIFTLADGVTKITLPRAATVTVGFDSYDTFYGSPSNSEVVLILPATLREDDYSAIAATVTGDNGVGSDVETRAAGNTWRVKVTKPTFSDGKPVAGSARVTLTPPNDVKLAETALLRVSIIDGKGREYTVTRPVKWFDGQIVRSAAGGLSAVATDPSVKALAIAGDMDAADFAYIRENLTALETLDLSMTSLTVMPDRGLAYNTSPNTTLRRVVLPEDITAIEEAAFANCRALEAIDTEAARQIGRWAFEKCHALRDVHLGDQLEAIANSAFMDCTSLVSIDIPAGVRTLGRWVFQRCAALESVTLHEGLQELSASTFYNSGIVSVRIPTTVTEIPDWAFQNCTRLERITLHDGITSIGEAAFLDCRMLEQFAVPKGLTVLSPHLFEGCTGLRFVELHDGITEIGERSFAKCRSLNMPANNPHLKLPASLSVVGPEAFMECCALEYVDMSETQLKVVPFSMFIACSSLIQVHLPLALEQIGQTAFCQCVTLSSLYLPATMKKLEGQVFMDCSNLKQIVCNAVTAPSITATTFDPEFSSQCTLYAPRSSDYSAWSSYFSKVVYN